MKFRGHLGQSFAKATKEGNSTKVKGRYMQVRLKRFSGLAPKEEKQRLLVY